MALRGEVLMSLLIEFTILPINFKALGPQFLVLALLANLLGKSGLMTQADIPRPSNTSLEASQLGKCPIIIWVIKFSLTIPT